MGIGNSRIGQAFGNQTSKLMMSTTNEIDFADHQRKIAAAMMASGQQQLLAQQARAVYNLGGGLGAAYPGLAYGQQGQQTWTFWANLNGFIGTYLAGWLCILGIVGGFLGYLVLENQALFYVSVFAAVFGFVYWFAFRTIAYSSSVVTGTPFMVALLVGGIAAGVSSLFVKFEDKPANIPPISPIIIKV
jgi:hypothetical protein